MVNLNISGHRATEKQGPNEASWFGLEQTHGHISTKFHETLPSTGTGVGWLITATLATHLFPLGRQSFIQSLPNGWVDKKWTLSSPSQERTFLQTERTLEINHLALHEAATCLATVVNVDEFMDSLNMINPSNRNNSTTAALVQLPLRRISWNWWSHGRNNGARFAGHVSLDFNLLRSHSFVPTYLVCMSYLHPHIMVYHKHTYIIHKRNT